jgi:hypothetical protein
MQCSLKQHSTTRLTTTKSNATPHPKCLKGSGWRPKPSSTPVAQLSTGPHLPSPSLAHPQPLPPANLFAHSLNVSKHACMLKCRSGFTHSSCVQAGLLLNSTTRICILTCRRASTHSGCGQTWPLLNCVGFQEKNQLRPCACATAQPAGNQQTTATCVRAAAGAC